MESEGGAVGSDFEPVPRFKTTVQNVDLRPEIESKLRLQLPELSN